MEHFRQIGSVLTIIGGICMLIVPDLVVGLSKKKDSGRASDQRDLRMKKWMLFLGFFILTGIGVGLFLMGGGAAG